MTESTENGAFFFFLFLAKFKSRTYKVWKKKIFEPSPCDQTFVVLENEVIASLSRDMYITIWHWIWNRQDWAGTVQQLRERDPPCLSWRQRKKEKKKNNTHIPDVFVCCCCCTVGKCSNLPSFSLFSCLHWVCATNAHAFRAEEIAQQQTKKKWNFHLLFVFCLDDTSKVMKHLKVPHPPLFFI